MNDSVFDSRRFRDVLGHLPTGVVVITATDDDTPVGMAVGSFTSVSLDPPMVAFFPDKSSSTFPLIRRAGRFCVNVLAADQEEVCRAFAVRGGDKFRGLEWTFTHLGSPVLNDVLVWLDCEIDDVSEAGDHFVVLGRVHQLGVGRPRIPLVFFQGGYGAFVPSSLSSPATADLLQPLRVADIVRPGLEALVRASGARGYALAKVRGEVVTVSAMPGELDSSAAGAIGQHFPLVPPWGEMFMAWSPPDEVAEWTTSVTSSHRERAELERRMASIRARGWAYTVRDTDDEDLSAALTLVSSLGAETRPDDLRRISMHVGRCGDPDAFTDLGRGEIRSVSAPVFDAAGDVLMTLALHSIPDTMNGPDLEPHVVRLRELADSISVRVEEAR